MLPTQSFFSCGSLDTNARDIGRLRLRSTHGATWYLWHWHQAGEQLGRKGRHRAILALIRRLECQLHHGRCMVPLPQSIWHTPWCLAASQPCLVVAHPVCHTYVTLPLHFSLSSNRSHTNSVYPEITLLSTFLTTL